ncbi:MAG: hypothetical protein AAFV95_17110 [Bacteroidota bacterium]
MRKESYFLLYQPFTFYRIRIGNFEKLAFDWNKARNTDTAAAMASILKEVIIQKKPSEIPWYLHYKTYVLVAIRGFPDGVTQYRFGSNFTCVDFVNDVVMC